MKDLLHYSLASAVSLFVCFAESIVLPCQAASPNVVIFLADDAGWGDFSHSGNQQIMTPHIDSIATAGVSLERFYVCPVCAPTRAEFLTGRYHPRGGVRGVSTGQERLDLDETTIADVFKAAGYATGAFGKWHNGTQWPYHPMGRGFDEYFGHTAGHWGEYFDAPLDDNGKMVRTQGYIVDVCTDRAIDFIERKHAKPFLCYVPFTTPHSPWTAPESNWNRFKDKPITQRGTLPDQEDLDQTRCALAMVENQDENVGRVLRKLKELQIADNTIVVYFSDNGPNGWRWNDGMKGRKGSTDEGGVRSVCYLRMPGRLPAGHRVDEISGAIDLLPTLTSLAGVAPSGGQPLDGRDLTPLLKKMSSDWPERMIFSTWAGRVSVRTPQYRLDHQGQLFDMLSDPNQQKAISDERPEVTARLRQAVSQWQDEMFPPLANPEPVETPEVRRAKRGAVDERPIPTGHPEFPITMLPARDGTPHGSVKRSSSAPNCSYFVNWTSLDDTITWLLDVHTAGQYSVTIDYTCPIADAGSILELQCGEHRARGKVEPGWDPPLYTNQDTLPRPPAESQMKPFRTLSLQTMRLDAGVETLTLRAIKIPGDQVMDVRRVTLTLLVDDQ